MEQCLTLIREILNEFELRELPENIEMARQQLKEQQDFSIRQYGTDLSHSVHQRITKKDLIYHPCKFKTPQELFDTNCERRATFTIASGQN